MNILLAAAVLPALVLLYYVYSKDKIEKEPINLIVRLFVFGMVAGPLAAIVENIAFALFETVLPPGSAILLICEYFIGVACVEEGFKYFFLNRMRYNPEFNYVFDAVVYSVAVSLGFAALENIFYVFDGGLEVAAVRAIFSVPGHAADGVIMGCFYGLARKQESLGNKSESKRLYLLAFLLPVIEHGFYDAALSAENDMLAAISMLFQLAFIVFAMILVNRLSKKDEPLYQSGFNQASQQQYGQPAQGPVQYPQQQQNGQSGQQFPPNR